MSSLPVPDLQIATPAWRRIPGLRARLKKAVEETLRQLPKGKRLSCALTVLLTDNAEVRRLNRNFRGKDKPTNVLSFPQFAPHELPKNDKKDAPVYMGDIALAYQYIVSESKKDHKILINHVTHLVIHGVLHLFGYDHLLEAEAHLMERTEQRIMAGLGLPDPYAPAKPRPSRRRRARP